MCCLVNEYMRFFIVEVNIYCVQSHLSKWHIYDCLRLPFVTTKSESRIYMCEGKKITYWLQGIVVIKLRTVMIVNLDLCEYEEYTVWWSRCTLNRCVCGVKGKYILGGHIINGIYYSRDQIWVMFNNRVGFYLEVWNFYDLKF